MERNGSGRQDAAKRQSGDAATRWPIIILLSNGSNRHSLHKRNCQTQILRMTAEMIWLADASYAYASYASWGASFRTGP